MDDTARNPDGTPYIGISDNVAKTEAKDARELASYTAAEIEEAYEFARERLYGYEPIGYGPGISEMAHAILDRDRARLASAREQGVEKPVEAYRRLWKEAERKGEEMRAAVLSAVNQLDNSNPVVNPEEECDPYDIAAIILARLNRARETLRAALATPAEGTTREGERDDMGVLRCPECGLVQGWHNRDCSQASDEDKGRDEALAHEAPGGKA
jgi:hypothetical protein